ncbi:MAG: dephospho-CoA kinase [Tissierellia bacterium]|nr:dephospho-CoA kinase [Tissierellia bacterium]
MNQNKIVVTGSIASGKSTLIDLLKQKGYFVISADEINKDLLKEDNKNYLAIRNSQLFDEAFDNNFLDKKKLAQIIFSNPIKRNQLNILTHRNIISEIERQIRLSKSKCVFIEIPLFFQMEIKFDCDYVWLVDANREIQIDRLMKRDRIDKKYAIKKIENTDLKKIMYDNSNVVFDNSGNKDYLLDQLNVELEKMEC